MANKRSATRKYLNRLRTFAETINDDQDYLNSIGNDQRSQRLAAPIRESLNDTITARDKLLSEINSIPNECYIPILLARFEDGMSAKEMAEKFDSTKDGIDQRVCKALDAFYAAHKESVNKFDNRLNSPDEPATTSKFSRRELVFVSNVIIGSLVLEEIVCETDKSATGEPFKYQIRNFGYHFDWDMYLEEVFGDDNLYFKNPGFACDTVYIIDYSNDHVVETFNRYVEFKFTQMIYREALSLAELRGFKPIVPTPLDGDPNAIFPGCSIGETDNYWDVEIPTDKGHKIIRIFKDPDDENVPLKNCSWNGKKSYYFMLLDGTNPSEEEDFADFLNYIETSLRTRHKIPLALQKDWLIESGPEDWTYVEVPFFDKYKRAKNKVTCKYKYAVGFFTPF